MNVKKQIMYDDLREQDKPYTTKVNCNDSGIYICKFIRKIQDSLEKINIQTMLYIPAIGPKFLQPILKMEDLNLHIEGDIVIKIDEYGFQITQLHFATVSVDKYLDTDNTYKDLKEYMKNKINEIVKVIWTIIDSH